MPPGIALIVTLRGSNYRCLEQIFMVPKGFEPSKFDCILFLSNIAFMLLFLKILGGLANSVDSDQTSPSGSALFALCHFVLTVVF